MSRERTRFEKFFNKRERMTYAPVYRKRKTEDAHVQWLWSKVQGGMQLEFERNGKLLMSHRTLDKLISLQELHKNSGSKNEPKKGA
jgi:hypothetical protein